MCPYLKRAREDYGVILDRQHRELPCLIVIKLFIQIRVTGFKSHRKPSMFIPVRVCLHIFSKHIYLSLN
jgi:hypothetical protein